MRKIELKRLNTKRGFTMVELLAVIVILGILTTISIAAIQRIIASAKEKYYESQEQAMVAASRNYAEKNKQYLPKINGSITNISLKKLIDAKYIEKVVDYSKNVCSEDDSFVQIFYYQNEYQYLPYLKCDNWSSDSITNSQDINIDLEFSGNASSATLTYTVEDQTNGLATYYYTIYSNDKLVFTSEKYIVNSKKEQKTISLNSYLPGMIKVIMTGISQKGESNTVSKKWDLGAGADDDKVKCGTTSGDSTTWTTGDRRITIACLTGTNGIRCSRDTFTKDFNSSLQKGKIQISDVEGNTKECDVNVYIDKKKPTLTINAYKRTSSGGKTGDIIATATANNSNPNATMNSYTGAVNGWLNNANFPYGIYFEALFEDEHSGVEKLVWKWNAQNLLSTSSEYETLGSSSEEDITGKTSSHNYLSGPGQRRSQMTITDGVGYSSAIDIAVNIDRAAPTFSYSCTKTNNSITCTVAANDPLSGIYKYYYRINNGSWTEKTTNSNTFSSLNPGQQYSIDIYVKDNAGNSAESSNQRVTTNVTYFGVYLRNKGVLTGAQGDMYRFVGGSPANYVCMASKSTCLSDRTNYLYRVIGVASRANMTGVTENSVKLVRNTYSHSNWGNADWGSSGTKSHVNSYNFGSYENLISNVCWKNGHVTDSSPWSWNANTWYSREQSWGCTSSKKAIIYTSDYLFAPGNGGGQACPDGSAGSCRGSWMYTGEGSGEKQYNYEFTLGTNNSFSDKSTIVIRDRTVAGDEAGALWAEYAWTDRRTRATFYLTSTTKYISGSGTYADPYIIG